MFNNISIGRYIPGDSILHSLDPRVKIVLSFFYMIIIFILSTWQGLGLALLLVSALVFLSKISWTIVLKSIKPILILLLFIFVLNTITIRTGKPIWAWKSFFITDQGLFKALLMVVRLLLLIISTSLLMTLTTTPLLLSDSLESLFHPLKRFSFPVHEMAMMMAIAMRFVPTLGEETDKIMKAQASRGAEFDTGPIIQRMQSYVSVLVPLFVSAFKRAEELAVAMDARCYQGGEGRTKLHTLKLTKKDGFWFFLLTLSILVIFTVDLLSKLL